MSGPVLLALAIAFELVGTASLKASDGFTRWVPSSFTVVGYLCSFYLLSLALRQMPVGVVYAIWSGAGTALMAVIGYLAFGETLNAMKIGSIGLIVLGVVGLGLAQRAS